MASIDCAGPQIAQRFADEAGEIKEYRGDRLCQRLET
jgi:hypothetical protein